MEKSLNENTQSRQIIYKGKVKDIPISNPDSKLCEFFIVARMRYCKFEKLNMSPLLLPIFIL